MKKLRILANIPRYDYGKKELGNSFEYDTFYTFFIEQNHQVDIFDYTTLYNVGGSEKLNTAILNQLARNKYDLIFTVPFTNQFNFKTLDKLKQKHSGAFSVAWMCDDKWRWEDFSKFLANHFDYIVTTDSGALTKYNNIGYPNSILSQWAHNPAVYKKMKIKKKYDVTFIGGISPWREYVINYLKKHGITVHCFGAGWGSGRLTVTELVKIYNQSKIVLNLSNSTKFDVHFLFTLKPLKFEKSFKKMIEHSFPGLVEFFLSKKRKEDIKARFFEVTASGSFLLSYTVENLENYLQPQKEFGTYTSLADLKNKIRYYLKNESKREKIAAAGHKRTSTEHTYKTRFTKVFKEIGIYE